MEKLHKEKVYIGIDFLNRFDQLNKNYKLLSNNHSSYSHKNKIFQNLSIGILNSDEEIKDNNDTHKMNIPKLPTIYDPNKIIPRKKFRNFSNHKNNFSQDQIKKTDNNIQKYIPQMVTPYLKNPGYHFETLLRIKNKIQNQKYNERKILYSKNYENNFPISKSTLTDNDIIALKKHKQNHNLARSKISDLVPKSKTHVLDIEKAIMNIKNKKETRNSYLNSIKSVCLKGSLEQNSHDIRNLNTPNEFK